MQRLQRALRHCPSRTVLLALTVAACSWLVSAAEEDATSCSISQYWDAAAERCVDFASPRQKAARDLSATVDSGNTAWLLMSSALVMMMTPGVAFFYAGLAGEEMASNTIMMSFVSMATVTLQFFLFGFSACFSEGIFSWSFYQEIGTTPSGVYGANIPAILFALFQTQFAMITPALLSGGVVGRMKFGTFIIFTLLWTSCVYDPLARWMWSYHLNSDYELEAQGWEARLGSLDFAGGTVIHVSSGFGALVAAIVVGKRYNHGEPVKPHNVPLVMIGTTLLWFGWFGFNGGSSGAADGIAALAAMNTHLSACAGFLTWITMEWLCYRKIDPCGAASGAIAGLVSITPGCAFVYPWASLIFGIIGAITAFACVHLKNVLRYDDTLDAFAIHGCAGAMGGLLTGLFATPDVNPGIEGSAFYGHGVQLWHQLVAQVLAGAYSAVVTFIILMVLKYTVGLRVAEDKEISGMDLSYHGGTAYGSPTYKAANPPPTDFSAMFTPGNANEAEEGTQASRKAKQLRVQDGEEAV